MYRLIIGFILYTLFLNISSNFTLKLVATGIYCMHLICELAINYLQHRLDNM